MDEEDIESEEQRRQAKKRSQQEQLLQECMTPAIEADQKRLTATLQEEAAARDAVNVALDNSNKEHKKWFNYSSARRADAELKQAEEQLVHMEEKVKRAEAALNLVKTKTQENIRRAIAVGAERDEFLPKLREITKSRDIPVIEYGIAKAETLGSDPCGEELRRAADALCSARVWKCAAREEEDCAWYDSYDDQDPACCPCLWYRSVQSGKELRGATEAAKTRKDKLLNPVLREGDAVEAYDDCQPMRWDRRNHDKPFSKGGKGRVILVMADYALIFSRRGYEYLRIRVAKSDWTKLEVKEQAGFCVGIQVCVKEGIWTGPGICEGKYLPRGKTAEIEELCDDGTVLLQLPKLIYTGAGDYFGVPATEVQNLELQPFTPDAYTGPVPETFDFIVDDGATWSVSTKSGKFYLTTASLYNGENIPGTPREAYHRSSGDWTSVPNSERPKLYSFLRYHRHAAERDYEEKEIAEMKADEEAEIAYQKAQAEKKAAEERAAAEKAHAERQIAEERLLAIFRKYDTNQDGALQRTEFGELMKLLDPTWDDRMIDNLLQAADLDRDGTIQFEEFIKWVFAGNHADHLIYRMKRSETPPCILNDGSEPNPEIKDLWAALNSATGWKLLRGGIRSPSRDGAYSVDVPPSDFDFRMGGPQHDPTTIWRVNDLHKLTVKGYGTTALRVYGKFYVECTWRHSRGSRFLQIDFDLMASAKNKTIHGAWFTNPTQDVTDITWYGAEDGTRMKHEDDDGYNWRISEIDGKLLCNPPDGFQVIVSTGDFMNRHSSKPEDFVFSIP